jgi:hypothetical protein
VDAMSVGLRHCPGGRINVGPRSQSGEPTTSVAAGAISWSWWSGSMNFTKWTAARAAVPVASAESGALRTRSPTDLEQPAQASKGFGLTWHDGHSHRAVAESCATPF